MTSEEQSSSVQQQQKRRAWLRRASTSSDNQPPPVRSSGRRLSAYDRIIAERVRRGITVSLERRSSVVSNASSEPESVDSGSGSLVGSGSGNVSRSRSSSGTGSGGGVVPQESLEASLRPLAPRADPLDETQMTAGTVHREGAARCQQAHGVPLLDHLIQLAAERGAREAAQQGSNSKPTEQLEEKRVRFREGWRSARGTGSLSALHEDEVKSVAERMAPCGILKNGNHTPKKEQPQENGEVCVNGETAEKLCKSVNRHAVEQITMETEASETEKAPDISKAGDSMLASASAEEGYENDDVFESNAVTSDTTNEDKVVQTDSSKAEQTPQSAQNANNESEHDHSTTKSYEDTPDQKMTDGRMTHKPEEEGVSTSTDDIRCELVTDDEPLKGVSSPAKEENEWDAEFRLASEENSLTTSSAPVSDIQKSVVKTDSEDIPAPYPSAATTVSSTKPKRSRLDSVPEEPPSSPGHLHGNQTEPTAQSPSTPCASEGEEGALQKTLPLQQLRSARGVPSRRWSVSGEPTSHRRDRAAISRRLVYLALSEEDGEPVPVFEEPTGGAVEFNPRRGEWRPLTGEEGRRLVRHRRMSLTKTCSLDFDRIP